MCSNTKKSIIVNMHRTIVPLCSLQVDQSKSLGITQRYAASGIVNDNVETTGILEYEEITG